MVYAYLLYVLKNIMQNSKRGAHIMSYHEDDCHDKRERRDKKKGNSLWVFAKNVKIKIECRCCMICAPQPCHCQKQEQNQNQDQDQKQDQDQNQDAIQVPIQTGSELEANQDQNKTNMQFKKVQTKTRTRPTYHSICQPRRGGSRPRPTYNAKPINHWSIP